MSIPARTAPSDFSARVRAARGYANLGRDRFAAKLNSAGASSSTLKGIEGGKTPAPLVLMSLVPLLAEVSGLPEAFFWGDEHAAPVEDRLSQIEDELRLLRAEQAEFEAEVLMRIDALLPPNEGSQGRQLP